MAWLRNDLLKVRLSKLSITKPVWLGAAGVPCEAAASHLQDISTLDRTLSHWMYSFFHGGEVTYVERLAASRAVDFHRTFPKRLGTV